jgi:hypothetical protein
MRSHLYTVHAVSIHLFAKRNRLKQTETVSKLCMTSLMKHNKLQELLEERPVGLHWSLIAESQIGIVEED